MKMTRAHITKDKAVPLWAVIGAPLVGVPLMVALLSLASPKEHEPVVETDVGFATEQVEVQAVDPVLDPSADALEPLLRRC